MFMPATVCLLPACPNPVLFYSVVVSVHHHCEIPALYGFDFSPVGLFWEHLLVHVVDILSATYSFSHAVYKPVFTSISVLSDFNSFCLILSNEALGI